MDRVRIHEGLRRMRFTDVLDRTERSELRRSCYLSCLSVGVDGDH